MNILINDDYLGYSLTIALATIGARVNNVGG